MSSIKCVKSKFVKHSNFDVKLSDFDVVVLIFSMSGPECVRDNTSSGKLALPIGSARRSKEHMYMIWVITGHSIIVHA